LLLVYPYKYLHKSEYIWVNETVKYLNAASDEHDIIELIF